MGAGSATQGSIKIINPAMVRANEGIPAMAMLFGRNMRTPVTAQTVKTTDLAVISLIIKARFAAVMYM